MIKERVNTILIPTNLHLESLTLLRLVLKGLDKNQKTKVILMATDSLSDGLFESWFNSPSQNIFKSLDSKFKESISILNNHFEAYLYGKIHIEVFHGATVSAMRNFLDANRVSKIFVPVTNYTSQKHKSFNAIPLLKKSGYPIREVELNSEIQGNESTLLQAILS